MVTFVERRMMGVGSWEEGEGELGTEFQFGMMKKFWREQRIVGISVQTVGNNIRIKEWLK